MLGGRCEGRPLPGSEGGEALVDSRQLRLRADRSVAVARKVLGRREHVGGVDAVHHRPHGRCDTGRVGTVAASPHDRGRPVADVRDRPEVEVEAELVDRICHRCRSHLADRHGVAGNRADGNADPAALLVGGRDQAVSVSGPYPGYQRLHCGRRGGVVVQVHHQQAAELALPPVGQHGVRERALEADHDHGSHLLLQRQPAGAELSGRAGARDRRG